MTQVSTQTALPAIMTIAELKEWRDSSPHKKQLSCRLGFHKPLALVMVIDPAKDNLAVACLNTCQRCGDALERWF